MYTNKAGNPRAGFLQTSGTTYRVCKRSKASVNSFVLLSIILKSYIGPDVGSLPVTCHTVI